MKILQVAMSFYPDRGGAESYVGSLAFGLARLGQHVVVAAPGRNAESYLYAGLRVRRIAVNPDASGALRRMYTADPDEDFARRFCLLLDEEMPDVVHFHTRTPEVSALLMRETRRRNVPVFLTYHSPNISCLRETLLLWGKRPCDGEIRIGRCTACRLQSLGIPRPFADLLALSPRSVGRTVEKSGLKGKPWTGLQMRWLVHLFRQSTLAFLDEADKIVTLCRWNAELLARNGLQPSRIIYSPISLCIDLERDPGFPVIEPPGPAPKAAGPVRCAFVGRFSWVKGVHILLHALRKKPGMPISLDLFGVCSDKGEESYLKTLKKTASEDVRVRFMGPLKDSPLVRLKEYQALLVPSLWLETGPLVVLEAFAAGVPVIGSSSGGIAELVVPEVNGLLVPPGSVPAWAETLEKLCLDRTILERLRSGVRPPRTMAETSSELLSRYRETIVARQEPPRC